MVGDLGDGIGKALTGCGIFLAFFFFFIGTLVQYIYNKNEIKDVVTAVDYLNAPDLYKIEYTICESDTIVTNVIRK